MIANRWQTPTFGTCSFKIVDEYYGECDGEQAYYLIVEYTGEPDIESIEKHDDYIQNMYSDYFNEYAMIAIYYMDSQTFYRKEDVKNYADYYTILYSMLLQ